MFLCVLVLEGCGKSGYRVYPASGMILVDGKPVEGVIVVLHPTDSSITVRPTGRTDARGEFQVMTYQPDDGAPAGSYRLTASWPGTAPAQTQAVANTGTIMSFGSNESKAQPVDQLNGRYAKPDTSGLKCEISSGNNTLEQFRLMPGAAEAQFSEGDPGVDNR